MTTGVQTGDHKIFLDDLTDTNPRFGPTTASAVAAADVALIAKGAASQTGDLFQVQNSAGTVLAKITSAGVLTSIAGAGSVLRSSTVAASAAINTAETVINGPAEVGTAIVAAQTLKVGSIVKILAHGTCTASAANASTFTLRAGILGTTSDASVATAAVTSATSGTGIAFEVYIQFTVQTLGATGTCFGSMRVTNTGVTGIAAVTNTVVPFTSSTLATTTATFLDLTYQSAASTTTCTFQDVTVEIVS